MEESQIKINDRFGANKQLQKTGAADEMKKLLEELQLDKEQNNKMSSKAANEILGLIDDFKREEDSDYDYIIPAIDSDDYGEYLEELEDSN